MALTSFLAATVLLSAAVPQQTNLDKLAVYTKIRRCTVKVYSDFPNAHFAGSGVAIRRSGNYVVVLTNCHVVTEGGVVAPKISARAWKHPEADRYPVHLIAKFLIPGKFFDLAFLLVTDPRREIAEAEIDDASPFLEGYPWAGKPVYACGNPREEEFLVTAGTTINAPGGHGDDRVLGSYPPIFHNALIEHGSSGGGLFNEKGKLTGINTWMLGGTIGESIPVATFSRLLRVGSFRASASYFNSLRPADPWQDTGLTVPAGPAPVVAALAVGSGRVALAGPCARRAGTVLAVTQAE